MSEISPADTEREAARIYGAIFRAPVPDIVASRFRLAADRLNQRTDQAELAGYYRAIRKAGDLEALEIAGRLTRSFPQLSSRFLIMVHIAETCPENQHYFINPRKSTIRGWWAFVAGGFVTALKLFKGLFLLKRYRHA